MNGIFKKESENNMEGIKRLADMLEGQKDKYLIIIVNHLMLQTEMNEAFLNEKKNLKDMATYIKDKAKKQAKDGVAVIEDEIVFKWAKDYFIKSNKDLGIKETRLDRGKHGDVTKVEIKENENEDEFESIFDFDDNDKNDSNTNKEEIEQISLFVA